MTIDELRQASDYAFASDHKELAAEYIERLIKKSNDPEELKDLRLQLADIYFEGGQMKEAFKIYSMYLNLYPGSAHRAYVHYQAILCRFYMSLSSDRDQAFTEEAFRLTQEYADKLKEDHNNIYTTYAQQVEEIQGQQMQNIMGYADYQEVSGVKFPFKLTQSIGPQNFEFMVKEIKVNEGVSASDFD